MNELKFDSNLEQSLTAEVSHRINAWENELYNLLPSLPDVVKIDICESNTSGNKFYTEGGWSYGTNGSTPSSDTVKIVIDTKTGQEVEELMDALKGTIFHEFFHVARGYNFENTGLNLLDVALEEGLATKFESIKAASRPWYGHYSDRQTMLTTLEEIREADGHKAKNWHNWKFYDPETGRHWILYRAGAFIIDEVLVNNPDLEIQDLVKLTRKEIMELSKL